jgi:hypothetical protein
LALDRRGAIRPALALLATILPLFPTLVSPFATFGAWLSPRLNGRRASGLGRSSARGLGLRTALRRALPLLATLLPLFAALLTPLFAPFTTFGARLAPRLRG